MLRLTRVIIASRPETIASRDAGLDVFGFRDNDKAVSARPRLAAVEPCAAQGNRLYQLRYKMQPM